MTRNRRFLLMRRPHGVPVPEDFAFVEEPVPAPPAGGIVLRNHYASLDPAQRGWMDDRPSYMPPIGLGEAVRAATVGVVHASDNPAFRAGDWAAGMNALEDYSVCGPDAFLRPVDVTMVGRPSQLLSTMGATGPTAYFGVIDVGRAQSGETLLVSSAAGAVGSIAGQIGRILGMRVIGIAGGAEKCRRLREDYGFDAAIDYRGKDVATLAGEIRTAAPGGIDLLFENVGGDVMDAALLNLAQKARIVLCGMISEYNAPEPVGIRNLWQVLVHRATIHGFLVPDYAARFPEAAAKLAGWIAEGKLRIDEEVVDGLENAHAAFLRLFSGEKRGKLILKIV